MAERAHDSKTEAGRQLALESRRPRRKLPLAVLLLFLADIGSQAVALAVTPPGNPVITGRERVFGGSRKLPNQTP